MKPKTKLDKAKLFKVRALNSIRKNLGLSLFKYGYIKCLKCGKIFFSSSFKYEKFCKSHKPGKQAMSTYAIDGKIIPYSPIGEESNYGF